MSELGKRSGLWNRRRPPPLVMSSSSDDCNARRTAHREQPQVPRCPRHSDQVPLSEESGGSGNSTRRDNTVEVDKETPPSRPAAESGEGEQRHGGQSVEPTAVIQPLLVDQGNERQTVALLPITDSHGTVSRELLQQLIIVENYARRAAAAESLTSRDHNAISPIPPCPMLRRDGRCTIRNCQFFHVVTIAPAGADIAPANQSNMPEPRNPRSPTQSPRRDDRQPHDPHAVRVWVRALLEDRAISFLGATLSQFAMVSALAPCKHMREITCWSHFRTMTLNVD